MHAGSAGESTEDFRILVALFLRLLVIEQHKFEALSRGFMAVLQGFHARIESFHSGMKRGLVLFAGVSFGLDGGGGSSAACVVFIGERMREYFAYDVFLSYSAKDRAVVREVAERRFKSPEY